MLFNILLKSRNFLLQQLWFDFGKLFYILLGTQYTLVVRI